ncbi:hypothetical protein [Carnobacterium divergens]|uniref:hypothetical protein n=1 Tax=Carnobacterium divergens TaxID=2748 RepID=UPI002891B56B|nr:hypothetical protein [Carnobacterium divergens]MDT2010812.1 hypothetical protein [Carnobacterium divergens]
MIEVLGWFNFVAFLTYPVCFFVSLLDHEKSYRKRTIKIELSNYKLSLLVFFVSISVINMLIRMIIWFTG